MSKKASPTVIGAFVVGAMALVVVGILYFGSGQFMKKKDVFILYFKDSVKGLQIGAPVKYKGVRIGSVTDIKLRFNRETYSFYIPVIIETDPDRIEDFGGDAEDIRIYEETSDEEIIEQMIEKGLRAQLQMQSLVTGLLFVQFERYSPNCSLNDHQTDRRIQNPRCTREQTMRFRLPL